jgi:hypothetical protein
MFDLTSSEQGARMKNKDREDASKGLRVRMSGGAGECSKRVRKQGMEDGATILKIFSFSSEGEACG